MNILAAIDIPRNEILFGIVNLIVVVFSLLFFTKTRFKFLRGSNVREWCFQGAVIFYIFSALGFLFRIPVVVFRHEEAIQEQALGNLLLGVALTISFILLTFFRKKTTRRDT